MLLSVAQMSNKCEQNYLFEHICCIKLTLPWVHKHAKSTAFDVRNVFYVTHMLLNCNLDKL